MTTTLNAETGSDLNAASSATEWIEVHADYLFNFALGQVRNADIAEDLVQDTLLAAWKGRERFAGQSSDRTWLTGILRHKIYDHLRAACRDRARRAQPPTSADGEAESWDDAMAWLHDVAAETQSPGRRLELAEFRENLEMALGKLPPRIAQVFQLYAMEDRSNAEVCATLGITESNLWVMLHRARKQLREHLAGWWHGQDDVRGHRETRP